MRYANGALIDNCDLFGLWLLSNRIQHKLHHRSTGSILEVCGRIITSTTTGICEFVNRRAKDWYLSKIVFSSRSRSDILRLSFASSRNRVVFRERNKVAQGWSCGRHFVTSTSCLLHAGSHGSGYTHSTYVMANCSVPKARVDRFSSFKRSRDLGFNLNKLPPKLEYTRWLNNIYR